MKAKTTMKKLVALLAVAAIAAPNVAELGWQAGAEEAASPAYNDSIVMQTISENRKGLAVNVSGAEAGAGITITQDPVAFDYNYLAIRLVSTYVDETTSGGDQYRPIQLYVNGQQVVGPNDYASLEAYNSDGTQRANVDLKWGGYIFLDPDFDGTLYIPKELLGGIAELTGLKIAFNGYGGELVVTDVLGCDMAGTQMGTPVVNENNLVATTSGGVAVSDGMNVEFAAGSEDGILTLTHNALTFDAEYLAIDMTVTGANENDPYVVAEMYVNGKLIGTDGVDQLSVYNRDPEETETYTCIENKWVCWNFIPNGFDGIVYIPKTLLGGITEISEISFKFDKIHSAKLTLNEVFACDSVNAAPIPTTGTVIKADEGVTMTATTISNTAATSGYFVTGDGLAMNDEKYVAVYMDMKSCNVSQDFTYIYMYANELQVLEGKGEIKAYPADGSDALTLECKWGNWVVIPSEFEGVIYFPVGTFFAGETELYGFRFTFDAGHTQEFDYKVGVADALGGTPNYLDLSTPAEEVTSLLDYAGYRAPQVNIETVMDVKALSAENGVINDAKVTFDTGITAFDEFSYSYVKFGGVSLEESWENQLVVAVKTQFEGGQPLNITDHGDDYGYLEFTAAEGFELADGLAMNVQCLSGECYFRVYVIDEDGGVWQADHNATDYTFVSDGAPIGMATLFNNFFYSEDTYGTLYIPEDHFVPSEYYNGAEIAEPDTELGKIVKVAIGMDMLYGLGRTMCVGAIANVDVENETYTRIFNPVEMTDEELGIPDAKGSVVACPGSELHVANFKLSRELLEDTPNYEEPEQPPVDSATSSTEEDSVTNSASTSATTSDSSEGLFGCFSSIGATAATLGGLVLAAGVVMKRKED